MSLHRSKLFLDHSSEFGDTSIELLDRLVDLAGVPFFGRGCELKSEHVREKDEVIGVCEGGIRCTERQIDERLFRLV